MPFPLLSEFTLGDMLVSYRSPPGSPGKVGVQIIPASRASELSAPREHLTESCVTSLPSRWLPMPAGQLDPLVHVHAQGFFAAGGFAAGRTQRDSSTNSAFTGMEQEVIHRKDEVTIQTTLTGESGLSCVHEFRHTSGEPGLRVRTIARNVGQVPLTLELLTAFSLGGITPFAPDDSPDRLYVHRFRTAWSAEARHEATKLEALQLERSWTGYGIRSERFGQLGSMPVRGWFPFLAVEDRLAGVFWGAQLDAPGSWQMELSRRGDQLAISGGHADREFGHWWKSLAPGEELASPTGYLSCVSGSFDELCDRLTALPRVGALASPERDGSCPIVFNEWCSSWGNPSHSAVVALADKLRGSGVQYLVIDDGWAERDPSIQLQQNGDWRVNRSAFPDGLRATCDAIRARGLIPGLWFEYEVVNAGTTAFGEEAHQLKRDRRPLQVGTRRFWDFRDPWVHTYLADKVIALLREAGFGYLKIDYNDSVGLGCDGTESPGEGLREHLVGVQRFLTRIRTELPELVIENCSSGGHRLEPSFMALTAMSSSSDAHETPEIPLIAANLHRLVLPQQLQVWAVVRRADSLQRLAYSMAAGFLGRLCLSGDVLELSPVQWNFVLTGLALYREAAPLIAIGRTRRSGRWNDSWRHLAGCQAVTAALDDRAMVIWHTFGSSPGELVVQLPSDRNWAIGRDFAAPGFTSTGHIECDRLTLALPGDWSGGVIILHDVATELTQHPPISNRSDAH